MSRDHVQIARRFVACWVSQDWEGAAGLLDPAVEQLGTVGGVEEGRVLRGAAEMRRDYEAGEELWDEHRVEPDELLDAGDRVVVFAREYQRGSTSGVELHIETAVVFDFRNGRIARIQGYMDRAQALEAVGLADDFTAEPF
jgi:ketosteroid isomerase-like protein